MRDESIAMKGVAAPNRVLARWRTCAPSDYRLMHHCYLLEFDARSYRLKEAAETLARKTKES
jgi:hypothetical protein